MIGTHREPASTSRLIERLRQISKGAPAPIGFGRAQETPTKAMLLVAVLPRNELALAEAAIGAGADAVVFRLCGATTEFLAETGDLAKEGATIKEAIAAIGDKSIVGIIVGSNGTLGPQDLPGVAELGADFLATYPHLTPAGFLELTKVGRVAILDQQGGHVSRGINDLSIQAALVRIERPSDSPSDMTVLDVATYRAAADAIHRPIIVFPTWTVSVSDLEVLKNAGIEALALVGPEPEAGVEKVEAMIAQYHDGVGKLGKPSGRRVALSEPAVIIPRVAVGGDEGGEEEPDEDDE